MNIEAFQSTVDKRYTTKLETIYFSSMSDAWRGIISAKTTSSSAIACITTGRAWMVTLVRLVCTIDTLLHLLVGALEHISEVR